MIKPVKGMKVEFGSSLNAEVYWVGDSEVFIRWSPDSKFGNLITMEEWEDHIESEFIIVKEVV